MDHLGCDDIIIRPFYVDYQKQFYAISPTQLYSNTPADFDFKLAQTAHSLSEDTFIAKLREVDLVFPVIHGAFGEDGELQTLLEKHDIPFVGPTRETCQAMFHKHNAAQVLLAHDFETLPSILITETDPDDGSAIRDFFKTHALTRAVVKPAAGGSSIGVCSVSSADEAIVAAKRLFENKMGRELLLEPFCEGNEFTVVVFQNLDDKPVALIPTEIETSYEDGQIFDYRRKYLPTANTLYHTPPRFSDDIVHQIQNQAETIFNLFKIRDFTRLDGWVMSDGRVLFTDLNPISGMEQNSFLFLQASLLGFTHREVFRYIIRHACHREKLPMPEPKNAMAGKQKVHVLLGGETPERQVSLMSGTNVWLKLRRSELYEPQPFLLDTQGKIWLLPYAFTLNHTVEEIMERCKNAASEAERVKSLCDNVHSRLDAELTEITDHLALPQKLTMKQFIKTSQIENAFVFLGLHGGDGEDGTIQKMLDDAKLHYNGSGPAASQICMDKFVTGEKVQALNDPNIQSAKKVALQLNDFDESTSYQDFWDTICSQVETNHFIIKPQKQGCSAGIVKLSSASEFETYIQYAQKGDDVIPPNTFTDQENIVEMSGDTQDYLLEAFIETDDIHIQNNELHHQKNQGWIELTVGLLEDQGEYHALNPSITVANGTVLTLEEKFQGGTGINLTPPPETLLSSEQTQIIKNAVEKVANALEIKDYARIDIFFNTTTNKTIIIEANTLPALTPSTVIYHQALAETPGIPPITFLEKIIKTDQTKQ